LAAQLNPWKPTTTNPYQVPTYRILPALHIGLGEQAPNGKMLQKLATTLANTANQFNLKALFLHLIKGDVLNLETLAPLKSSTRVNALKQSLINTIADKDKVIYPANNEKYSVHVFTDVDCPFCKRLHAQVPKMNELGITVKYLASPLASLHPAAQGKMEKIWCAKDKIKAMNDYKTKNIVPNSSDCANPVACNIRMKYLISTE
jgi:thiol:disulfide interchange protein DsbC